jgi:hypothetical protein
VRRIALEGLEPASEVVSGNEVGGVLPELIVALVVEAFDRGVLDRAVHPLAALRARCGGASDVDIGDQSPNDGDALMFHRNTAGRKTDGSWQMRMSSPEQMSE